MTKSASDIFEEVEEVLSDFKFGIIKEDEFVNDLILCLFDIRKEHKEEFGLDSYYNDLVSPEWQKLAEVIHIVGQNAVDNAHKRPKMTTLLEEISELYLSCRGKHEHLPSLEATQSAGVLLNMLWQMHLYGYPAINNVITNRGKP